ncbi:hypothetical protein HY411_02910 [Candidatus Gottesmanbacteria bacterium]|nr:hypothetical protein [Candidatus Gottesmanbacteria bacterium]
MGEIHREHTVLGHTRIQAKDVPNRPELATIQRLNPDNPLHIQTARALDLASPEVINPYTGDHTPLTDEQLKQWMAEEVYIISPRGSEEPVGYVYLYPDEGGRLSHIRKTMRNIPQDARITEFNFWAQKDAKSELVQSGLRQALARFFAEPTPPRYAIMYVEPEDMMDAKLLEKVGGRRIGDISYDAPGTTEGPMDMVYLVDAAHFVAASRATSFPSSYPQGQTTGL